MTHDTDCTVLPERRDEVDEIARLYDDGSNVAALERANDLGWELIGGGAGRKVFRTDATEGNPCIIKFAKGRGAHAGRIQNREEIEQYESFPAEMVDADPPVVVPVRDYDRGDYLWLTAPEVEQGGSVAEVQDRLARSGYFCEDMHRNNVGIMHGHAVVLDYGLDCRPQGTALDLAEELADELDRVGARNVEAEAGVNDRDALVSFHPPAWVGDMETDPPRSKIAVEAGMQSGARHARLRFGPWDVEAPDPEPLERVADEIEDWWGLHIIPSWVTRDVGAVAEFEIEVGHGEWPPEIVADVYDDFLDEIDEVFDGVYRPDETASEIRKAIRNWALDMETTTDALGGEVTFYPPQEDGGRINPGLERPSERSGVRFSTTGVTEIRYVVGPWRHGEPRRPTVAVGSEDVVDFIENEEIEATWRKLGHEHDEYGKVVEVTFTVTPGEDVEDGGWTPDRATTILTALPIEVSNRLPRGREAGDPVQQPLDEFADIDAAIRAAIGPDVTADIDAAIGRAVGPGPG